MPVETPDTLWIRLALPGVSTELVLVTWFPQMKTGSVQGVVLTTTDIADTHAKLKARKWDISDIKKQPWGLEATFRDPDGNGWVLQQIKVIGNPTRVCGRPREGLEYIWRIPAYTDTFNLIASPGRGEGQRGRG